MKKYICISNDGILDPKAFLLLGASTKRGEEGKIGQFGTGLNYSIAWLLNNNIDFKIFAGTEEFEFGLEPIEYRDKVYQRITFNGEATNFTVDMGYKWEPWYVLREIYCNAIDEEGAEMKIVEGGCGEENKTKIFIALEDCFSGVIDDWDLYFSEKRDDLFGTTETGVKVYPGGKDFIMYRKGIRCAHMRDKRCVFNYDLHNIEINESREVKSHFELRWRLTQFWAKEATVEMIKKLSRNLKGSFEEDLYWEEFEGQLSNNWKEAIGNKTVVEKEFEGHYSTLNALNNPLVLPATLAKGLMRKHDVEHVAGPLGESGITVIEPDEKQSYVLKQAELFFKETEYNIPYEIKVAIFNRKGRVGQALDGVIYISEENFHSLYEVISCIVEECEHLNTGFNDETRSFQNHFIKLFIEEKCKRFAYTI